MKPVNFVGEMFVLRKIQILTKKGWLGWQKGEQKLAMAKKAVTEGRSHQRLMPPVLKDAQLNITKSFKPSS